MSKKNESNVDRIRDIIFGSQMRESEEKFTQVNSELSALETRLVTLFEESHTKLRRETERSLEVLETKIDNLASIAKKDKSKLRGLIDATEESLQERLSHQQEEFSGRLKMMKENAADEHSKIIETTQSMKVEVEAALKEGLGALAQGSVSRESMAQMLVDMAMKVQGTEMDEILDAGEETER